MKKRGLFFVAVLLCGAFMSGCEAVKDATDISFTIERSTVFTVDENALTTTAYNLDLNDSEEYRKYKGNIREVEIDYVRYQITSNTGGGGQAELYANFYGGPFATATKVAGPISFAAGETRGVTDIAWLNKYYFESLLATGQLSVWAVAVGTNVHVILPVELKVKVTVNVFE